MAEFVSKKAQKNNKYGLKCSFCRSREWDQIDSESSRERIPSTQELSALYVNKGMDTPDMLIATIDNQVIDYAHVFWRWEEEKNTLVFLHLGWILPQWRRKGIGTALLS